MPHALPPADEQLQFLKNLQRLLDEGTFTSTYKFALLLALADLAVERGDVGGEPLPVEVREIADKLLSYYWRQAVPFPAVAGGAGVLLQNTGRQAAIVEEVGLAHAQAGGSIARARADRATWSAIVNRVASTVRVMPLWKLQTVRGGTHDFLYANVGSGSAIALRPGVAFCLRVFHGHIQNLVQGAWVRWVRRLGRNAALLGQTVDLHEFLFGTERVPLANYTPLLREQQADACFYCRATLHGGGEVDHFIPWSRYPLDLGHNFVLVHRSCNIDKSDLLADVRHLTRWVQRNRGESAAMTAYFDAHAIAHDLDATESVAQWAYGAVEGARGDVWTGRDQPLVPLEATWHSLF
jgi:hypothetical protein